MKFKNEMKYLLEATYEFWEVKDVDDEVINVTKWMFRLTKFITYSLAIAATICFILFSSTSLYAGKTQFLCHIPEGYYAATYISQLLFMIGGLFIVIGFDGVLVYLCYKCVTQFQILKYRILNIMDYKDKEIELNKCIEHHAFLLRSVNFDKIN